MAWIKTLPPEPGRYWYRETRPLNPCEPKRSMHGIALVKWKPLCHFLPNDESKLHVRSHVSFDLGYGMGELDADGGWSAGGDLGGHHAGREFWSEPLVGPPGLLQPLPPRPTRTDEEKAALVAEEKESSKRSAAMRVQERSELEERIETAKRDGETLYECECGETISGDDLVQVRECSKCDDEARFNGDDNGQNCPTCNRTFSRNLGSGAPCCFATTDEMTVLVREGALTEEGTGLLAPPAKKPRRRA